MFWCTEHGSVFFDASGLTTSTMPARSAMTFVLVSSRWTGMLTSSMHSQVASGTRLTHSPEAKG